MMLRTIIFFLAAGLAAASQVRAASEMRSYDDAASCKALSEFAPNVHDEASKTALDHINKAIDAEIADGKTRDQADADIDYARFNWEDTTDIATRQSEWRKCVERWKD